MDILKYGGDVQVLAPESLRTAVLDQLRSAAKHYGQELTDARR
jgi:predicted DNA-binding transcriptional regulator YafY